VFCRSYDVASPPNRSQAAFTVRVEDNTPPTITAPAGRILSHDPVVTYAVSATDAVDGDIPVTCSHPSGSTFAEGVTVVTCTAQDAALNAAAASFEVEVLPAVLP
jgi:hypothetical protein